MGPLASVPRPPLLRLWEVPASTDPVWRAACRAEAGGHGQGAAGTVLWGMEKYYERSRLQKLYDRGKRMGVCFSAFRLEIQIYRGPRAFCMNHLATSPMWASCGIPAGSKFSDILVIVYTQPGLDWVSRSVPEVELDACVDDLGLGAEGTEDHVFRALVRGAAQLRRAVGEEFECTISLDTAAVVASSPALLARLRRALGPLAGEEAQAAVWLGVDHSAGKRRSHKRVAPMRRARMAAGRRRAAKLRRHRAVAGARVLKVVKGGLLPALTYDAPVHGVSTSELRRLRATEHAATAPRCAKTLLIVKCLLHGDLAGEAALGPALTWHRMVWEAAGGLVAPLASAGLPLRLLGLGGRGDET